MNAPIIIEAAAQHSASLIFLHGLGDSGFGWAPVMRQLSKKFRFMKFICPHAPERRVTLNGGMRMPSWYDIYTLNESDEREDEAGLRESSDALLRLVKAEQQAGIPAERVFIGGFSQGGAVSIFATLAHPEIKLAGIIALSAYVPCRRLLREQPPLPLSTPIFMAHGTADMVVQYRWHKHSVDFLRSLGGGPVQAKAYEGMDHAACEEEIVDVAEFIESQLRKHDLHSEL